MCGRYWTGYESEVFENLFINKVDGSRSEYAKEIALMLPFFGFTKTVDQIRSFKQKWVKRRLQQGVDVIKLSVTNTLFRAGQLPKPVPDNQPDTLELFGNPMELPLELDNQNVATTEGNEEEEEEEMKVEPSFHFHIPFPSSPLLALLWCNESESFVSSTDEESAPLVMLPLPL